MKSEIKFTEKFSYCYGSSKLFTIFFIIIIILFALISFSCFFLFQRRKTTAAISRKERTKKFEFVNYFKDKFSFLASLFSLHLLSMTVVINVLLKEIQLYCLKINLK